MGSINSANPAALAQPSPISLTQPQNASDWAQFASTLNQWLQYLADLIAPQPLINTVPVGSPASSTGVLMSETLAANVLNTAGMAIRITAWGTTTANTNLKDIFLYWDSTLLASAAATANGTSWQVNATLTVNTAGTSGVLCYSSGGEFNGVILPWNVGLITGVNLTTTHTIECKGTGVAVNDIVQNGMLIEFFN
jgi:hypothetical protein